MPRQLNDPSDSYVLATQKAIFAFQMVEEALKICVGLSHEIIRDSAPPPVAFDVKATEINRASLGRLISMYSRVTTDRVLVDELKGIVEWRNFCAHEAFKHEFMRRRSGDPLSERDLADIRIVIRSTARLVEKLCMEIGALQKTRAELPKSQ